MSARGWAASVMVSVLMCGAARIARAQAADAGGDESASSSPSPNTGRAKRFKQIDALLAQLAESSRDMDRLVSGGPEYVVHECLDHFSMAGLTGAVLPNSVINDLAFYYQCRTSASDNPLACSGLDQYRFKSTRYGLPDECRRLTFKVAAARSIISQAPGAMDRCMAWMTNPGAHDRLPADTGRKMCALICGGEDLHAVAAEAASLLKLDGDEVKEVENHIGEIRGEERVCREARGDNPQLELMNGESGNNCGSFAAYRKAFAARDARLCGNFTLCRIMMGNPPDCDALANRVGATYCHDDVREKYRETFNRKWAQINALLARAGQDVEGFQPKNYPGLKSRKDRFLTLRGAVQKYGHEFKAGSGAKRGAAPNNSDDQ